jgi:Zn-dependent protease
MSLAIWPTPFIIDPNNLAIDAVVTFVVSILIAVTINAEGQAFMAAFLGDNRPGAKDRFHFIAFLHLDLWGTVCYLAGGFGWPRTLDVDPGRFKRPRLYTVITRFAGPIFNLLLASIAGSLVAIMKTMSWEPRVFLMVVGVNITTAVYNLIPLPPLAAGFLVCELLPASWAKIRWWFLQTGPFIIIALVLLERITRRGLISPYLDPIIRAIFNYLKG